MKTISPALSAAFADDTIRLKSRVIVEWGSNRFNDGQVVTASSTKLTDRGINTAHQTETLEFWRASDVFNNKNRNSMKYLVCDNGARVKAEEDGTGYRAAGIKDSDVERGWWSANKSNASGNFTSPEWVQSEFFTDGTPFGRMVNRFSIYAFEHYANIKGYRIYYKNSGGTWIQIQTGTLGASEYIKHIDVSDTQIFGLKIEVTSTQLPNDFARLSEFNAVYVTDVTEDVVALNVTEKREEYEGTVPIGTTAANTLSLELDNTSGTYNKFNEFSPFHLYMGSNVKIMAEIGAWTGAGYEYVKMGTFYTDEWDCDGGSLTASVGGRDGSKFLQDDVEEIGHFWKKTTIASVFSTLLARKGYSPDEIDIDSFHLREFDLLFIKDDSPWAFMGEVAFADQGVFGFDEDGNFYYHSYDRLERAPYNSPVYTFNYDTNIESASLETILYTNSVKVEVSAVNLENTGRRAVWSAESPSILGWTAASGARTATATTIPVKQPPNASSGSLDAQNWKPTNGFLFIPVFSGRKVTGGELIKYKTRTATAFTGCERGYWGTKALPIADGAYIGEARVFDVEYDNSPMLNFHAVFVDAIDTLQKIPWERDPQAHIIVFEYDAFKAKLAIGNIVNWWTWLAGTGPTYKDKWDGNTDTADDVESQWDTLIAGEVAIEDTGKQEVELEDKELKAENPDYIRRYGRNDIEITSQWIQSRDHAEDIANIIIEEYKGGRLIVSMEAMGYPALQLGDRVIINNYPQLDIQNEQFHIIEIDCNYDGGLRTRYMLRQVKQ